LAGCASWFPSNSAPPIASWSGKHSIDDAVDCVKRALDGPQNHRFRTSRITLIRSNRGASTTLLRPLGRTTYESNPTAETTTIELSMPGTMYIVSLRDSLAKCHYDPLSCWTVRDTLTGSIDMRTDGNRSIFRRYRLPWMT
jgi:hypothetical protein